MDLGGKSGATARSPIGTYPGLGMVGCCVILWALLLAVNSQLSGVNIFHVNQCRSSFYYSTDSTPYMENKIKSVQSNLCFIIVAFRGHCLHAPDISRYLQISPGPLAVHREPSHDATFVQNSARTSSCLDPSDEDFLTCRMMMMMMVMMMMMMMIR